MAKATATKKTTIKEVTLTLSAEEAEALVTVLSCVGGSPVNSARRHTQAMTLALSKEGVNFSNSRYKGDLDKGPYGSGNMVLFKDFNGAEKNKYEIYPTIY